jgi:hypothetical protein
MHAKFNNRCKLLMGGWHTQRKGVADGTAAASLKTCKLGAAVPSAHLPAMLFPGPQLQSCMGMLCKIWGQNHQNHARHFLAVSGMVLTLALPSHMLHGRQSSGLPLLLLTVLAVTSWGTVAVPKLAILWTGSTHVFCWGDAADVCAFSSGNCQERTSSAASHQ